MSYEPRSRLTPHTHQWIIFHLARLALEGSPRDCFLMTYKAKCNAVHRGDDVLASSLTELLKAHKELGGSIIRKMVNP